MTDANASASGMQQHQIVLTTNDGQSLKKSLARALRREKIRAFLLILPLLAFIVLSFLLPIADMLLRSVANNIVADTLPKTTLALESWEPKSGQLPDEQVYADLYDDLSAAFKNKTYTQVGLRLNYENPGMSSLFRKTGPKTKKMEPPYKQAMIDADAGWGDIRKWETIKYNSSPYTIGYFLTALDLQATSDGIVQRPENERLYLMLFQRTILVSLLITITCLILGYPISFLLAHVKTSTSNLLLIMVLLPFWTSLLVRTSAWKVLLQQNGVINDLLVWANFIDTNHRLSLINNQTGTIIAMTHILLPFMILPLFSVMKTISPTYVRAAKSMGANDWTTFWRVYFPNTIPGIGAGAILVFILAIGYYITPELVGGTSGVFISNRIAYHIQRSLNWGLAAALGTLLLFLVLALYWLYDRIVGIDNVKLG